MKKKGKVVLKVLFEIDIKKIIRKRNCIELLKDWIGKERMEKQIVVKDEDITDKDEDFLSFIDL